MATCVEHFGGQSLQSFCSTGPVSTKPRDHLVSCSKLQLNGIPSFPERRKILCSGKHGGTTSFVNSSFWGRSAVACRRQVKVHRSSPITAAYVSAPAAEPGFEPDVDEAEEPGFATPPALQAPLLTWGLVVQLLAKEKLRLVLAVAAVVGGTACTLTMPQFSGKFFETLVGKRKDSLNTLLANLLVAYIAEPLFTVIFVTSMSTAWENVTAKLRTHLYSRLLVQKVEFFDRHKVGELTQLLGVELNYIKAIVSDNLTRDRGLRSVAECVGTFCILFNLAPTLAPVLAILVTAVSIAAAVYKRATGPVFQSNSAAQARLTESASETFGALRTVRSFGGEMRQISLYNEHVEFSRSNGERLGRLKSYNESVTRLSIYVSLFALYWTGGNKVKAGELAVGTVVAFIGYTFTLTFAVQGLVNTLGDLRTALAAIERINAVCRGEDPDAALAVGLDRQARGELDNCDNRPQLGNLADLAADAAASAAAVNGAANGTATSRLSCSELAWKSDVILEDVFFSYPLRPAQLVLRRLNLTLPHGTVTALVGQSGAGKSTVVQLLSRFYEPNEGRILLAGQDVRNFDKSEWSRAVSLVNQEPVLFAMSVADNIAYGAPSCVCERAEIEAAAKAANAHEFIINLPQGYDTMVGERGSLLSGGQRQRIAIARALLKNSPILILDEATSALDSTSERLVQEAIDRLVKGRTTVVIAHRLSTVQNADQIVVLDGGRVAEKGTHKELVARGGAYAKLVANQRLSFE